MATPNAAPSERTRVRRLPERATYDAEAIAAVVDAAPLAHIGFAHEGSVHVIPTAVWREGGHLYIHGAKASRLLKALVASECCVTLSLLDGLVMARSAFHHSMNYRSVVVYGRFETVDGTAAKFRSLQAFMEKLSPGRWNALRPVSDKELNATTVLRLSLAEASLKARSGGPKDDDEDMAWPVWAGVLPLSLQAGAPQTDPQSVVREAPSVPLRWG
ncbi:pyridoxamine 5'-phosphate oxidase family protein [Ideonella livida]|uniref:Pyridoxamine 5'-phosphate oxidase family protein n=1 Tax=Ideonella livida TaxID=2707176 RepID=A0A7C9TP17_9BURK|nr:pyridoxamine 5'-phosphate oxidase family protein [Ideonella livida]NDY93146.1 pyridoxamine 5'-phosphate oxidase family protein [Ideonella livida]